MKIINSGITVLILTAIFGFTTVNSGITIDKLKLEVSELPEGYKFTDELICQAIQPELFYENPNIYAVMIGEVKNKSFQAFTNGKDEGSILYFEYEKEFEQTGFLSGLLWGGNKPSKVHPEEFMIKGNVLIIWSTVKKSPIKEISKKKIKSIKS